MSRLPGFRRGVGGGTRQGAMGGGASHAGVTGGSAPGGKHRAAEAA
jgi:hypothetical protein